MSTRRPDKPVRGYIGLPNKTIHGSLGFLALWIMLLVLPCGVPVGYADDAALAAAVNVAGRQRMLSQRIVKAYCEIGLDVLPERASKDLKEAVASFDRQLEYLQRLDVNKETQNALFRVSKLWFEFKPLALGTVSRKNAGPLQALSEELLNASQRVVELLETQAGGSVAPLVNIAGRQRMLSQRLAKLYMLYSWGFKDPQINDQIKVANKQFSDALDALIAAPENTDEILRELNAVDVLWMWFEISLELKDANSFRLVVSESSGSILVSMDAITRMYERLAVK